MKPLKHLQELKLQELSNKSPNFPEFALPIPKYSDKTANGLTKCIIHYIQLNGGQAERINVISRQVKGKFIKSTMTNGTADISATVPHFYEVLDPEGYSYIEFIGLSVKIEVKIGKDRQSDEQKDYEEAINNANGIYYIAKDFDSFYEWYNLKFK